MSVICEPIGSDDEVAQAVSKSATNYEEELDYEEEIESNNNNHLKGQEDGELSDDSAIQTKPPPKDKQPTEKDEGELDEDEDLEDGELKEDESEEEVADVKLATDSNTRNKILAPQDNRNSSRNDNLQRHGKSYYSNNNSHWPNSNQNYNNSRYNNNRYSNNRNREHIPPPAQNTSAESAWERGLKQARELLSKASKRKEEEVDFDNKRVNMTVENETQPAEPPVKAPIRERSPAPLKRRRHSSQHESSEDEIERRHRLAYDAAPWNNQSSSNYHQSSSNSGGNYRNRTNNYSSNRGAETYRDPWRRSKSPKPSTVNRNRRPDVVDTRYGEIYKRERQNLEPRRSDSMSSLSSLDSTSSKSPGRKLPYSRPNLETRTRYERESEITANQRNDYPKSRMDRIPKKSNASPHFQTSDRVSETKSFDSWSESLSDSDSSSFFTNSDSSDESDANSPSSKQANLTAAKRMSKKSTDKRSQSKLTKKENDANNSRLPHSKQFSKDPNIDQKANLVTGSKGLRGNIADKEAKKPPIKMTFMKTQTSLKKDRLIDEQLNGETFELEDKEANNSRSSMFSSGKSVNSKSQSEDEETKVIPKRKHKDSSSSSASSSTKNNRREELLMKLKAVEEAIERKLNSKRD